MISFVNRFFILLVAVFLLSCATEPPPPETHGFNGFQSGTYYNAELNWHVADLTTYISYPEPGSEECIKYNGCTWAGQLQYFQDVAKSQSWIQQTHIVAVHSDFWSEYIGKKLRIWQETNRGVHQIDVMIYDICKDSDCNGCCTANKERTGFLIDMEIYTFNKFGGERGEVQRACLDC